jgi:hypothetical protein
VITMTARRRRLILIITFAALVLGVASTVVLAAAVGPRISPRSPFLSLNPWMGDFVWSLTWLP